MRTGSAVVSHLGAPVANPETHVLLLLVPLVGEDVGDLHLRKTRRWGLPTAIRHAQLWTYRSRTAAAVGAGRTLASRSSSTVTEAKVDWSTSSAR